MKPRKPYQKKDPKANYITKTPIKTIYKKHLRC